MTLHQTQSTKHDRGTGVSRILRSYKCRIRMLIFTRKRDLNITVSTERKTNADTTENPEEVKKGKRRGRDRGRKRPWDQGFLSPVPPRPCLFAQFLAKRSSVVPVGDNPILLKQTKQKATSKSHCFPSSKCF